MGLRPNKKFSHAHIQSILIGRWFFRGVLRQRESVSGLFAFVYANEVLILGTFDRRVNRFVGKRMKRCRSHFFVLMIK